MLLYVYLDLMMVGQDTGSVPPRSLVGTYTLGTLSYLRDIAPNHNLSRQPLACMHEVQYLGVAQLVRVGGGGPPPGYPNLEGHREQRTPS